MSYMEQRLRWNFGGWIIGILDQQQAQRCPCRNAAATSVSAALKAQALP